MTDRTRRDFLKQAALGTAFLAYPHGSVLGANDRVRVGMIGVGSPRNSDVLACCVHRSCSGLYHSQRNG
jgi:hypothetical protein